MKKTIYLAGGCFWGVQAYFKMLEGVIETKVGYANGTTAFPKYEDLKSGKADHAETVKVVYDDEKISLSKLLEHDEGHQYRSGVYYEDVLDGVEVNAYFAEHLEKNHAIEVIKLCNFFPAESYHQDYLDKNPGGYCHVNLKLVKDEEKKKQN